MNDKQDFFPQYLAAPLQVLWFEADELAVMIIFFTISSLYGGWFWLSLILGPFFYLRIKKKYPKSFIKHLLYFAGLKTPRNYPSFFEKLFLE